MVFVKASNMFEIERKRSKRKAFPTKTEAELLVRY